jgi:uncharacterized protein (DUF433 family)
MLYTHFAMFRLEIPQIVPLTQWEDGSVRITGSRVKLDYIIREFKDGASPEHIQDAFPSLSLREIYGAIFYYLDKTEAVDEYLKEQERAYEEGIRFIDTHFDTKELRARIRARHAKMIGR